MNKNPILVVDDDDDDRHLIKEAAAEIELTNEILFLDNGKQLVDYLKTSEDTPFVVLCDVNLPGEDGFALRKRIAELPETRYKGVPFIFWSTGASEFQIRKAYDLAVQGFFQKANTYRDLCNSLRTIVEYWKLSQHPKPL